MQLSVLLDMGQLWWALWLPMLICSLICSVISLLFTAAVFSSVSQWLHRNAVPVIWHSLTSPSVPHSRYRSSTSGLSIFYWIWFYLNSLIYLDHPHLYCTSNLWASPWAARMWCIPLGTGSQMVCTTRFDIVCGGAPMMGVLWWVQYSVVDQCG